MRLRVLSALLVSAASAFAQAPRPDSLQPQELAPASGPAAGATKLRAQLSLLRLMGFTAALPTVEQFTSGNRTIPADSVITGAVGVTDGSLEVFGTINGAVSSFFTMFA